MYHRENYTPGSEIRRKIGKNFENLIIISFLIVETIFLAINLLHVIFVLLNSVQRITFHARNTSISMNSIGYVFDLKFNLSHRLSASLIRSVQNIATPEYYYLR